MELQNKNSVNYNETSIYIYIYLLFRFNNASVSYKKTSVKYKYTIKTLSIYTNYSVIVRATSANGEAYGPRSLLFTRTAPGGNLLYYYYYIYIYIYYYNNITVLWKQLLVVLNTNSLPVYFF